MPDTLIPHAGASLEQELSVELADGAAFVAAELLAPGRHGRSERFAYKRVRLTTVVRDSAEKELCVDALEFEPSRSLAHGTRLTRRALLPRVVHRGRSTPSSRRAGLAR